MAPVALVALGRAGAQTSLVAPALCLGQLHGLRGDLENLRASELVGARFQPSEAQGQDSCALCHRAGRRLCEQPHPP